MQRPQPVQPIDITHSYTNINLNALSQTRVATLKFPLPGRGSNKAISGPISILSTFNPAALCFHIKQWLIDNFSRPDLRAEGILRMEYQQLDRLESSKTGRDLDGNEAGWLLLAEEACYVNGDRHLPVTVMGVLVGLTVSRSHSLSKTGADILICLFLGSARSQSAMVLHSPQHQPSTQDAGQDAEHAHAKQRPSHQTLNPTTIVASLSGSVKPSKPRSRSRIRPTSSTQS